MRNLWSRAGLLTAGRAPLATHGWADTSFEGQSKQGFPSLGLVWGFQRLEVYTC